MDFRKLPRRVPVKRLRHGASARAQLGSLVAVAFRICSSFSHSQPPRPLVCPGGLFGQRGVRTAYPYMRTLRAHVSVGSFGIFRRLPSLSELLQLFALQTRVSVVAFARALSSSSGAYQLRATVRRPYRRTREGRRGESLSKSVLLTPYSV